MKRRMRDRPSGRISKTPTAVQGSVGGEEAPARSVVVALRPLEVGSDRASSPRAKSAENRRARRSKAATERFGSVPASALQAEPKVTGAQHEPSTHPSDLGTGRVEAPSRRRGRFRAVGRVSVEPASSTKRTAVDLVVVPPSARGREQLTLRLRRARVPAGRALILLGAGALSLAVLASAMLVRHFASGRDARDGAVTTPTERAP